MLEPLEAEFQTHWSSLSLSAPYTLLLSGGGDSVSLFHLLLAIGVDFKALHFVHDGQQDFAEASRFFCEDLCARYRIALELVEIGGKPLAAQGDLSWEAACRHLRYRHLALQKGSFLTAHTIDDQAETVLMRLLQGSGLSGLAGIRPQRDDGVARPLLSFQRKDLRAYLESRRFGWLEDPTNIDGNDRARLRHQIFPSLLEYKPNLLASLSRTADRSLADEEYLLGLVQEWLLKSTQEGDSWSLAEVQSLPPPLRIRFLKLLWKSMSGPAHRPRASFFQACAQMIARGNNEAEVLFPGGWALVVLGSRLWLRPSLSKLDWTFPLAAKGPARVLPDPEGAVTVSSELSPDAEGWRAPAGSVLRPRRPGDRFLGRCLKKVPATTRQPPWVKDRWPLMVAEKKVVAVWGLGASGEVASEPNVWIDFRPDMLRANIFR